MSTFSSSSFSSSEFCHWAILVSDASMDTAALRGILDSLNGKNQGSKVANHELGFMYQLNRLHGKESTLSDYEPFTTDVLVKYFPVCSIAWVGKTTFKNAEIKECGMSWYYAHF